MIVAARRSLHRLSLGAALSSTSMMRSNTVRAATMSDDGGQALSQIASTPPPRLLVAGCDRMLEPLYEALIHLKQSFARPTADHCVIGFGTFQDFAMQVRLTTWPPLAVVGHQGTLTENQQGAHPNSSWRELTSDAAPHCAPHAVFWGAALRRNIYEMDTTLYFGGEYTTHPR